MLPKAGHLLTISIATLLLPTLAADPTITVGGGGSLDVAWNFQDPANYTLNDVEVRAGQASLRRTTSWRNHSTQGDFINFTTAANVNLTFDPGSVLLNDTTIPNATYESAPLGGPAALLWRSIAWGSTSLVANLSDEFNGTSLDTKWSWLNPPTSYSVGSPRPGYLTFTSLSNTNFNNGVHSGQFLYQEVDGDFDIQVRFEVTFTSNTQKAGLLVMDDLNNWYGIYRRLSASDQPLVRTVTTTAGVTSINGTLVNASPDYLRVRRMGNALETYYSYDGSTWSSFLSMGPGTLPSRLWVGFFASDSGTSTVTVDVDYIRFSFGPATVQVMTRTGNSTVPGDATWSPWSPPHANRNGSSIAAVGRYAQYRLLLSTTSRYVRPLVSEVLLTAEAVATTGLLVTRPISPGNATLWSLLVLTADLQGGAVEASYSFDGANWAVVQPGPLNVTAGEGLRLRLVLTSAGPSSGPVVLGLRIVLDVASGPPVVTPTIPWWYFLAPLALVPIFPFLLRRLRGPFHPTDLFLIHTDGRLVMRVGSKYSPMKDDVAVSGMFTLMAKFVQDSFGGSTGGEGLLKSLKVDENLITIARGGYLFLALVSRGQPPPGLEQGMVTFLEGLELRYERLLRGWDGLGETLGAVDADLTSFLARGHRRSP